jgi:hypothetical protein
MAKMEKMTLTETCDLGNIGDVVEVTPGDAGWLERRGWANREVAMMPDAVESAATKPVAVKTKSKPKKKRKKAKKK